MIVAVVVVGALLIWAMVLNVVRPAQAPPIAPSAALLSPAAASATLVVFDGTKNILEASVSVSATSTVFSTLQSLAANSGISLAFREYPGVGYLVTKIGDMTNGAGGAYWQYWVNGVYAQESADHTPVHGGDNVLWKFASSQQ